MSTHPDGPFDHYKVLQVDPEADPEVIQAAYRRLAQKWHPDVAPGPEAAARMVAINQAWDQLSEPLRRAAYDHARAEAARRADASTVTGSTRRWTDRGAGAPGPAGSSPGAGSSSSTADPASGAAGRPSEGARPSAGTTRPPEQVSRDWTSGRSSTGHTYDSGSMRTADGRGAAGTPPGDASGSVLNFGRYAGWSLGEIGRQDLEYLEWLDRTPIGRIYRDEIDHILRRTGRRRTAAAEQPERRGLFRRR